MSKYKVGDKIVLTVTDIDVFGQYKLNDNFSFWAEVIDKCAEPLLSHTEVLQDEVLRSKAEITDLKKKLKTISVGNKDEKIRRQAAEITRLLAENAGLKEQVKELTKQPSCDFCDRLEGYETARANGQREAWELAKRIGAFVEDGGFTHEEILEIFNLTVSSDVFNSYTYEEAAAKVAEWERQKDEIKVGDELVHKELKLKCVLTCKTGVESSLLWGDGSTSKWTEKDIKKYFSKTGRHIDIEAFLMQIGGEE